MTAEANAAAGQPVGRVRFMDAQRVNLDGFAVEDADLGLVAMRSPYDPEPGLVIRDGETVRRPPSMPQSRCMARKSSMSSALKLLGPNLLS